MRVKPLWMLGVVTGLLALVAMKPAQAQSGDPHFETFNVSFELYNDATGELLAAEGTYRIASSSVLDGSGGLHVTFQIVSSFTAIGLTTGEIYVGSGVFNYSVYLTSDQPTSTVSLIQNYRVVTSGGNNNLFLKELFHFTVNANGEITAFNPDEYEFVIR